jgi:hypothetical protein
MDRYAEENDALYRAAVRSHALRLQEAEAEEMEGEWS